MKRLLSVKIILTGCFFLFSVSLFGQSTDSIKTGNLSFKWNKWRLDGKRISKMELKAELMKIDEAFLYYKKSRRNYTIAYLSAIPFFTFAILSGQASDAGKTKFGLSITGLIFSGFTFYELARSSTNGKKATRIYNEKRITTY